MPFQEQQKIYTTSVKMPEVSPIKRVKPVFFDWRYKITWLNFPQRKKKSNLHKIFVDIYSVIKYLERRKFGLNLLKSGPSFIDRSTSVV